MKPRVWWIPLLLGLALLGIGLARLRLDVEILNLLPDDVPAVKGLKLYQQHFANSRELIVTLKGPTPEATETAARMTAEALRPETNLVAEVVWQPPWMEHPEHLAELIAILWLNQPPEVLADLTNRLAPDKLAAEASSAREQLATSISPNDLGRLAYDPFGFTRLPEAAAWSDPVSGETEDWFSSDNGLFRVVFVEPRTNLVDYHEAAAFMTAIRARLANAQESAAWPSQITVQFTGGPPFLAETASSMEGDMKGSAIGTLVIIAGLFWWAHRRFRPLLWLMVLLVLIVLGAMGAGGLIFGSLNIVSLGFAAILMGLAVDYAMVMYQESVAAPDVSAAILRRKMAPSIVWAALTTASAFALLNFGDLPGLSQLGSLVAIGILLAAGTMLFAFVPVARKGRQPAEAVVPLGQGAVGNSDEPPVGNQRYSRFAVCGTGVLALFIVGALASGFPKFERGTHALRLADCPAQIAVEELQQKLKREADPLMLVFTGRESEIAHALAETQTILARAKKNAVVQSFDLPAGIWPNPERQLANRATLAGLAARSGEFERAALGAGFTSKALGLSGELFRQWQGFAAQTNLIWPANASCRWLVDRFAAQDGQRWLALGVVNPPAGKTGSGAWEGEIKGPPGVYVTSWPRVGEALSEHIEERVVWLIGGMLCVVAVCLWLAFRSWREPLLSFVTLVFSGFTLLAIMKVGGWSWNLMNSMAIPLLLGAGVDYTIHVQLSLRRHGGEAKTMRRITGRALFLCAGTTVAGFGSLAWSSSAGLSSLGQVCAAGVGIVYLTSVWLLPAWWKRIGACRVPEEADPKRGDDPAFEETSRLRKPSGFYRAGLWRIGLALVRILPRFLLHGVCMLIAELYYLLEPRRRAIVTANLLPVCAGNVDEARRATHRLFRKFAHKLAELWRFESGFPVHEWITEPEEWETIRSVHGRGHGLLLLTLHLGNWEHGGLLLAQKGIKLIVLTRAEPGDDLTRLRSDSRARWGIETMVLGEDSFALIEVLKRLQDGAAMAVSIDRPPMKNGVKFELFGMPFFGSTSAADLAWASGCGLVGVTVVPTPKGYRVKVLPEFTYDRKALRDRETRRQLMQRILRAFEPEIREHLDQWYHFIPIWSGRKGQ